MGFILVVVAIRHANPSMPILSRHRRHDGRRRHLPTPVPSSPVIRILTIVPRLSRRSVRVRALLRRTSLAGRSDPLDCHRRRVGSRDCRSGRVPSGFRAVAHERRGRGCDACAVPLCGGGGGCTLGVALGALPLAIAVARLTRGAVVTTRVVAGLVGGREEVGA